MSNAVQCGQTNSSSPGSPSSGCCYRPKALAWLETAMRLRDAGLVYLKTDPLLDALRKEARFQAIAQALKFPD